MEKKAAARKPAKKPLSRKSSGVRLRKGTSGRAESSPAADPSKANFVILTGMSGSGKGSVLKSFEDLGYYCVDNLPVDLIPKFAELYRKSNEIPRAALVVDIREGEALQRFPSIYRQFRREIPAILIFLHASNEVLVRRFSETRRPHPLGGNLPLPRGIAAEQKLLAKIRNLADMTIDTSKFNVHELRNFIADRFRRHSGHHSMLISCISFGYRHGIPIDSDLVFDVRFLPNPNYTPKFHDLTGKHPAVAKYIRSFPQTQEFTSNVSQLLAYLIPHYMQEGKSYLTISFGCTGGHHRSVMIAETIRKNLAGDGFRTKVIHRDIDK